MNNLVYIFSIPKEGESPDDNQDVACSNDEGTLIAIADGVSSSLFSKEWAQILTSEFCRDSDISIEALCKHWYSWLRPLQEHWRKFYLAHVASLPWYAKGSADKDHGSATFVGLKIYPKNSYGQGLWKAISIGDSCLFHISSNLNQVKYCPPIRSHEFKSISKCVSSLPEYNSVTPTLWHGEYSKSDYFFLATDAASQWIIESFEKNDFDKRISELRNYDEFSKLVSDLRLQGKIHNDDTSIVIVYPDRYAENHLAPKPDPESVSRVDSLTVNHDYSNYECFKHRSEKTLSKLSNQKIGRILGPLICLGVIIFLLILVIHISNLGWKGLISNSNPNNIKHIQHNSEAYRIYYQQRDENLSKSPVGVVWFDLPKSNFIWILVSESALNLETQRANRETSKCLAISNLTPVYKNTFNPLKEYEPTIGYLFKGSYFYELQESVFNAKQESADGFQLEPMYWVKIKLARGKGHTNYYFTSDDSCAQSSKEDIDQTP